MAKKNFYRTSPFSLTWESGTRPAKLQNSLSLNAQKPLALRFQNAKGFLKHITPLVLENLPLLAPLPHRGGLGAENG